MTAGVSGPEAVRLVQAGVAGILHKHHSTDVLCKIIRQVAAGESCLEKDYLTPLFRSIGRTRTSAQPKLRDEKLGVRTRAQVVKIALEHYRDQL